MGYLMLFHFLEEKYGLNVTWSTYASEGGNFGFFTSHETMKRLNAKMYAEAKRLGVKWILGGECGHMWRVIHQYMDTMNGPADHLEVPVNPITGTRFEQARSTKMVHIAEFTADLIRNDKLDLDPSRNDNLKVTFHDSCNASRGMGMFDEPRYVIQNVCNALLRDAGEHDPRADLLLRERVRPERRREHGAAPGGGLPRANAVKHVHETHGVNMLAMHLRHRPGGAADADGLLGAGRTGRRHARAGRQRPEPARAGRSARPTCGGRPGGTQGTSGGSSR